MAHRAVSSCAVLAALILPFGVWIWRGDASLSNEGKGVGSATQIGGAAAARTTAGGPPASTLVEAPVTEAPPVTVAQSPSGDTPQAEDTPQAGTPPPTAVATGPRDPVSHLLSVNQMIVFYGSPLSRGLGILGAFDAAEAADRVRRMAKRYDKANGDRGAIGALDLIYALAMDHPTDNGLYLRYLDDATVERYVRVAEEYDLQLLLDLQIGRGDVVDEVRKIERFLLHPRVHVAIDPEYAVGADGAPLVTSGSITGEQINAVQEYLAGLVSANGLPPKMAVIHQYMDETVVDGQQTRDYPDVDLVLNMDAFGATHEKGQKYRAYAQRPYAERHSYNIFLKQDDRVLSEAEVLELAPAPHVVFYQ